jgi:hypothetical protein
MPAQVNAGDLLVAIFTSHAYPTVTTPPGWTFIGTTLNTSVIRTSRYAKKADGTEGGTTVDFQTSQTETAVAHVYRITGWFDDGVIADAVVDAGVTGNGFSPDPPALDPAPWDIDKTLWIAAYGAENLGATSGFPAGYTGGRYDASGGVAGRSSMASARRDNAVVAEDPGPFTNDASQAWVAVTMAIRPGGVQPPPVTSTFPVVQSLTGSSFALGATDHAVPMPATVSAGDLLLCIFANNGAATVATPNGWTLIGTTLGATSVRTSRYAKRADGTEGGTTVNFQTSTAATAVAQLYRVTGWFDDGVLADAIADAAASGNGFTPDPPALDPAAWDVEKTLWIAAYGAENLAQTTAYPADYANGRYDQSGAVGDRTSMASSRRENAVATEDPGPFTNASSQPWVAVTLAIRPKAAN